MTVARAGRAVGTGQTVDVELGPDELAERAQWTKERWRQWSSVEWKARRANVDAAVVAHLVTWFQQRTSSGLVATYRPMPSEVDVDELLVEVGADGFCVPRLADGAMTMHPSWWPDERSPFGTRQPRADAPTLSVHDIDAVLVPLRAIDRRGHRLGRGGGHYDRWLASLRESADAIDRTVQLIGVAIEAVVVQVLPIEPHDVALDGYVTEHGLRWVASSSNDG
jgi:5-formyltetrahydrofolate cyclo-ligase